MPDKETVRKIALAMSVLSDWSDHALMAATGLAEQDLDRGYKSAELVLFKARSKPQLPPCGDALRAEIESWVDFYFPPAAGGLSASPLPGV